jgi:alcohol dehydrogenase
MTSDVVEYLFPGSVVGEGLPMGHEAVGVVAAVGDEVTSFSEGDRVVAGSLTACGQCDQCLRRDRSICTGGGKLLYGCQAEYFLIADAELITARVPNAVSDE